MDRRYKEFLNELPVESRILLLCGQAEMPDDNAVFLQGLTLLDPDWVSIHDMAFRHSLLPLVYRNIRLHLQNHILTDIASRFKKSFSKVCGKNMLMSVALEKSIQTLAEEGIRAFPFKGPVMAALYGNISLRQFGDVDILINKKDICNAVKVLREQGYTPSFNLKDSQLVKLSSTDNEYQLVHSKSGLMIDLQWELTGGYFKKALRFEDLQERISDVHLVRRSVSTFTGEPLLMYLCIHGTQHLWQSLDHLCCVNETIRITPDINWSKLLEDAKELGAYRMLGVGLLLAKRLLNSKVPEDVVEILQGEKYIQTLVDEKNKEIVSSLVLEKGAPRVSRRFDTFHLRILDSRSEALRYLFHLIFVPTRYDWEVWPLPAQFAFLHYIMRPSRMLRMGLLALIGK